MGNIKTKYSQYGHRKGAFYEGFREENHPKTFKAFGKALQNESIQKSKIQKGIVTDVETSELPL